MTASRVQLTQGSAPSTPSAGLSQIYVNTAKQVVIEDDDGNTLTAPLLGPTSTEEIAVKSDLDDGDAATLAAANAHSDTNDALQLHASQLDTDTALAANSDARVASQKAAKAYTDAAKATAISTSEAYADTGDALNLAKASNLFDLASASAARTNLGLGTAAVLASDTDVTLAANSDLRFASQKATKAYVDGIVGAQDAMVFKGVQDCSGNPNYPAADRGWTYRVSVAGKIGGASGVVVEVGDIFICLDDSTSSGNQATVGTHWGVIQTNIDGAVTGPASSTDGNIALFNGATGKVIKDAGIAPSSVGSALITAASAVAAVDTLFTPDVDIASAATVNLGASTSYFVNITGTVTVTSFGTAAAGVWRLVRFAAACPITYDATTMRLQGGESVTTAANDYALCISRGSGNWRVIFFPALTGMTQVGPDIQVFTSSGTWSKKPWAKRINLFMRGAGAGGGSGRRGAAGTARSGGLGGFAGATFSLTDYLLPSKLPDTVTVTIGAKGTGGIAQTVDSTNGNDGTAGGDTTFGSLFVAAGGLKGPGGTNAITQTRASSVFAKGTTPPLASSVTAAVDVNTAACAGGTGGSLSVPATRNCWAKSAAYGGVSDLIVSVGLRGPPEPWVTWWRGWGRMARVITNMPIDPIIVFGGASECLYRIGRRRRRRGSLRRSRTGKGEQPGKPESMAQGGGGGGASVEWKQLGRRRRRLARWLCMVIQ
jgi:hypothetical protein